MDINHPCYPHTQTHTQLHSNPDHMSKTGCIQYCTSSKQVVCVNLPCQSTCVRGRPAFYSGWWGGGGDPIWLIDRPSLLHNRLLHLSVGVRIPPSTATPPPSLVSMTPSPHLSAHTHIFLLLSLLSSHGCYTSNSHLDENASDEGDGNHRVCVCLSLISFSPLLPPFFSL